MKRFLVLFLAAMLITGLVMTLASCQDGGQTDDGKGDETQAETTANEEKKLTVYLDGLTLDDERYSVGEFKKDVYEYTVGLPDGRPTVPRVKATAPDGFEVKISQAAIPDEEKSGKATVVVTNPEGESATYTVNFERSIVNGFVLQYDDRWVFNPGYYNDTGDAYVFESSKPDIISVDENGVMIAKKVADEEVILTAKQGDVLKATFVVDRVEKAHINLFFITGQSNGQGCYDSSNYGKDVENLVPFEEQLKLVEPIGGEGRVYSYDVFPRSQNTEVYKLKGQMYDMATVTKQGHQNSLGKTYYDLTGEKVVFLQSAYSGAPIESWLDHRKHKDIAGTYGGHYFYAETLGAYNKLLKKLEDNYEIVCKANFWCQGETAMTAVYSKRDGDYIFSSDSRFNKDDLITDENYYKYFMMLHEDMKADFGLDYSGIMFVKSKGHSTQTTKIIPIISAQFALCNNNEDIFVATRKFIEISRWYKDSDKTSEGYGFIGTDNTHYNQIGYNYHGAEAATNAFYTIFGQASNKSEGVEIISNDGIRRFKAGENIQLTVNQTYRIGALSVPHYINENVTWSSSDESLVTVDMFGKVTAVARGTATVTATAADGNKQSITVVVK